MEEKVIIEKIKHQIEESKKILVVSHRNPDGDTLGSALAITNFLDQSGKDYTLFCQDKPADFYCFLPKINHFKAEEAVNFLDYDLFIALDCGDLEQAGLASLPDSLHAKIINIDHHFTNTRFGGYNLVKPEQSATAVIVHYFFLQLSFYIDKETATALLLGLVTDTGNFSNPSTTPESMEVAAKLVARGARVREINNYVLRNRSLNILKLWSRIFLRLKKDQNFGLTWTIIRRDDLEECGVERKDLEGVANFFNDLADSDITLIIEELEDGEVKVSLRTTKTGLDVSRLAKLLGGGGHPKAAGFRVRGRLVETADGWSIA